MSIVTRLPTIFSQKSGTGVLQTGVCPRMFGLFVPEHARYPKLFLDHARGPRLLLGPRALSKTFSQTTRRTFGRVAETSWDVGAVLS